ncbi:HAMP domain-containing methyl-accepting chemotaxis protein [Rhodospira trueperi]|uniref:Methyl-accepting chemotaxis protein n=1 Tax=Rhodospira trueperi TaxID=69960 RepID=A0A1G7FGF4_9PROT|nr:methyl-accepting chemotaxis protein [Rhodospira trueperi]SDE74984.1 methyl-accepting chemotaxis protein [Rhodospira trueperi]
MLKSIRIGPKLYGGFGVVLTLLVILGAVTTIQLNSIGGIFDEYRSLARSANEIGRVQANMLMARMGVLTFIRKGDQASIDEVRERADATREFIGTTRALIVDPEASQLLDQMRREVDDYTAGFKQITDLHAERVHLNDTLVETGIAIERTLTEIMRSAYDDQDAEAAYLTGLVLRNLLLGRLYVQKFLEDNAKASSDRAMVELGNFDDDIQDLNAALQNPGRRQLMQEAIEAKELYADAFDKVITVINTRDGIMSGQLDVIGPRVAQQVEDFKLEVKEQQDTLGPQAMAAISQTITITIVVAVIAIVLGVAAAWTIGAGITKPIHAMTAVMGRLANKDYAAEIPAQDHKDEVGDMAKAVQIFKDSMQQADRMQADQLEEARKRDERAKRIAALNDQFDRGVSGILEAVAAAATQLQSTSESMASIAEETNSQATTVAAASEEASTNVQTVASAAEELSSSINEIGRQVQQSSDIAAKAAAEADRTNKVVAGLADSAQKIGEVVNLITDIADQTNLLALNATIEAARAGDAGKGFAVVANEVKSLASQTAKATEDIGRQIGSVQTETQTAVSAIEGITEIINRINEVTSTIASAVEEQNAATQEIARNVQQASQGTTEVSSTIVGVTEAAREAGTAADSVLQATNSLNEQSTMLKSMVEKFLADVRAA